MKVLSKYFTDRLFIVYVIVFISNFAFTWGSEDDNNLSDGTDEVSIEAIDVDDDQSQLKNLQFSTTSSHYHREENDALRDPQATISETSAASTSDNSTAVSTIYLDVNGSLSGNGTVVGNGTSVNTTVTSRYQRVKVSCAPLYPEGTNATGDDVGIVEIVNMTHLMHGILVTNPQIKARSTPSNCTSVLFFTHWCPWSAKAAPHYNALARAFRNIRFTAIDSSVHSAINTYYGVLSVPTMVLFYNGKILAKFNETTFNVNQFAEFITTFTDQKPGIRLNVTSIDFVGPVPSTATKGHDWYLYLSWTFIIACFIYYISKTAIWHRILELVQNSWREAEAVSSVPPHHHFHQD